MNKEITFKGETFIVNDYGKRGRKELFNENPIITKGAILKWYIDKGNSILFEVKTSVGTKDPYVYLLAGTVVRVTKFKKGFGEDRLPYEESLLKGTYLIPLDDCGYPTYTEIKFYLTSDVV